MLVYAGNPVLSAPGGARLDTALEQLQWCVAVDMYVTETSRHADVILPPLSHLERDDVDIVMPLLSVRNHLRYNPAALPADPGGRSDWQILMGIAARLGRGPVGRLQNRVVALVGRLVDGPDRVVDLGLRVGPYGPRRGRSGLTIARLKAAPQGIDLGPLAPRLPGALGTRTKRVQLAPAEFIAEAGRLEQIAADRQEAIAAGRDLVLIGRRQLRSNNSWMHNAPRLMKGADRCTARLHPDDATARGLSDGDRVVVTSTVASIEVPLEVSDEIRPGVVSIPHGYGHTRPRIGWNVAAAHPGASMNDITDPTLLDRLSGNAAYNAVPVSVHGADRTRQHEPSTPQAVD
jgi:anaerobic selenocysteine-containing dehydrogenase